MPSEAAPEADSENIVGLSPLLWRSNSMGNGSARRGAAAVRHGRGLASAPDGVRWLSCAKYGWHVGVRARVVRVGSSKSSAARVKLYLGGGCQALLWSYEE